MNQELCSRFRLTLLAPTFAIPNLKSEKNLYIMADNSAQKIHV